MATGGNLSNETTRTQKKMIREHLLKYGWIDDDIARELCGCRRLSGRIHELRHDPVNPMRIATRAVYGKNRFGHVMQHAKYILEKD